MSIQVIKANGSKEEFMAEKANKVVIWAGEELDVCPSDVLMRAKIQLVDGMRTSDIHLSLIHI